MVYDNENVIKLTHFGFIIKLDFPLEGGFHFLDFDFVLNFDFNFVLNFHFNFDQLISFVVDYRFINFDLH